MHNTLAIFAARFAIPVSDAYVLPALFERRAQIAKMTPQNLVEHVTYRNHSLGEYLANAAKKVAAKDRKKRKST